MEIDRIQIGFRSGIEICRRGLDWIKVGFG